MAYQDVGPACEINNTRFGVAFGRRGTRGFERYFRVWTTNPLYGPNEICNAAGLPAPYEPYFLNGGVDSDATCVMVELSARLDPQSEEDNRYIWIVTAKYSNDVPDEGIPSQTFIGNVETGSQSQPWLEPAMIRYESEVLQRAEPNDLNGDPYVNSANQPFSPPFTMERARRILVITRNQRTFDFNAVDAYSFATNSDIFTPPGSSASVAPGEAQCFPIHGEHAQRGSVEFWKVSYRIRIGVKISVWNDAGTVLTLQRESFRPVRVLDAGMGRSIPAPLPGAGLPVPIFVGGFPISQPVCLNGFGQPAVPPFKPKYRQFSPYPAMPFTALINNGIG